MKFLDIEGLKTLWSILKGYFLSLKGGTVSGDVTVNGMLTMGQKEGSTETGEVNITNHNISIADEDGDNELELNPTGIRSFSIDDADKVFTTDGGNVSLSDKLSKYVKLNESNKGNITIANSPTVGTENGFHISGDTAYGTVSIEQTDSLWQHGNNSVMLFNRAATQNTEYGIQVNFNDGSTTHCTSICGGTLLIGSGVKIDAATLTIQPGIDDLSIVMNDERVEFIIPVTADTITTSDISSETASVRNEMTAGTITASEGITSPVFTSAKKSLSTTVSAEGITLSDRALPIMKTSITNTEVRAPIFTAGNSTAQYIRAGIEETYKYGEIDDDWLTNNISQIVAVNSGTLSKVHIVRINTDAMCLIADVIINCPDEEFIPITDPVSGTFVGSIAPNTTLAGYPGVCTLSIPFTPATETEGPSLLSQNIRYQIG